MADSVFTIARVQEVITDEFSIKYNGESSIGAVVFTLLGEPTPADWDDLKIAHPLYYNISHYPVANEIVILIESPPGLPYEFYYLPPMGSQRMPGSNAFPNAINNEKTFYQGRYFSENAFLKPLRPYEGDITIEGRFGNTLRFGSTVNNQLTSRPNGWSEQGNLGDPITIISNGKNTNHFDILPGENITENIHEDDSSIYLCTNQRISQFRPASLYDESYRHDIYKNQNTTEPDMSDNEDELPEDLTEDISLTETEAIPPQELQQINELSTLENTDSSTEVAHYDISPTENQAISPSDNINLPDNYSVPDTVDTNFLNEPIPSTSNITINFDTSTSNFFNNL